MSGFIKCKLHYCQKVYYILQCINLQTKEDRAVSFRTAIAKSVYQWTVKQQQSMIKANDMFLLGRMAFIYNMEDRLNSDILTTLHRSKVDCPVPEAMITVSMDGSVLDRIAKIMSYLETWIIREGLEEEEKEEGYKRCAPPPLFHQIFRIWSLHTIKICTTTGGCDWLY